jgi:uncharacterized protein GlcG (DUF336 family)
LIITCKQEESVKKATTIGALGALCMFAATQASAEDPMMVSVKRLSLPTALTMAQAAVTACQKEGIQIGVTVVDRNGIPQVVLRDTVAPPITLPISFGKAKAAVMFNAPTSELADRGNTPVGQADGMVMSAGAVPIQVGGHLLGGIGVSGAPSGETDEMCAKAGFEAVQDDLEMAG